MIAKANDTIGVEHPPIIEVHDLSFRYAASERWVLRHVNLTVRPGETVLILGPSGCGKSTLALCLNGLIPALIEGDMTGRIVWNSDGPAAVGGAPQPGPSAAIAHGVASVFQDPETQMVMPRVAEEVAFGLENLGVPASEMPARIDAALRAVGLETEARTWVDDLSGGQKQRLALAATLALEPNVLVLDEPTANLDPQATAAFFDLLRRVKAERRLSIVLIEHRLDAVLPLVDTIVAMNRSGGVLASGATRDVLRQHSAALQAEGVWLPVACTLMQALRQQDAPTCACPVTLDEAEAVLRGQVSAAHWPPPAPTVGTIRAPGAGAAVELEDVSFSYPGGPPALQGINLTIGRGRFFALVGANGSGKTTLAKHLVGLLRPTRGRVVVLGQDAARRSPAELARHVGYVFQNPEHQFVTDRVRDELAYSLRGRWSEDDIAARVLQLLTTFGLQGYEDENPFNLSQGQKRRLSVATMVALDQPALILDEPSFGQDQQSTAALMATLRELHARGVTIVFISHDMQLVAEYADEVAVLSEGRIVFQGAPRDLFTRDDVLQQAGLLRPPLVELARRLGLPPLLTVEEWTRCLSDRLRPAHCPR